MDRRQLLAAGAAVASFLPAARALTAQETTETEGGEAAGQIDEAKMAALEGGAFLMMTSQVAQEKGQSDNVKAFADLEVAEQQAIARAYGAEGTEIPLKDNHAQTLEQLRAAEGADFDRAYLDAQIAGHEEARPIHEQYAGNGDDPMARGASMVAVTEIDSHLVMLKSFREQAEG